MAKFFIPSSDDSAHAEQIYDEFCSQTTYPLTGTDRRLCGLAYTHDGKRLEATVGEDFADFPEVVGVVLAIVETQHLVYIFTVIRGALSATPIYVSPTEVLNRTYFDN